MKNTLLIFSTVLSLTCVVAASAGTVSVGAITLTQIGAENSLSFDNNTLGATSGTSTTCGLAGAYCGPIEFALTSGQVSAGSVPGVNSAPTGDASHYLWDVAGGIVWFGSAASPVATRSFDVYWGSIDGFGRNNRGNNDTICLSNGSCVNGADLVPANNPAAAALNPVVNGNGDQSNANDNQWFRISSATPFSSFTFSSTKNAFEFDMPVSEAIPEPATWALLGLGFAGLAGARLRRSSIARAALA